MKLDDALKVLLRAEGHRVKFRGSKFGNALQAKLLRAALIEMDDDFMVLTDWGVIVAQEKT